MTQTGINGGRFILALVVGLLVCTAASIASYLFAVEPFVARGSTAGWVAATLAVAFALNALIAVFFTRASYVVPDPLPFRHIGSAGFFGVGDVQIQARAFFVLGVGWRSPPRRP